MIFCRVNFLLIFLIGLSSCADPQHLTDNSSSAGQEIKKVPKENANAEPDRTVVNQDSSDCQNGASVQLLAASASASASSFTTVRAYRDAEDSFYQEAQKNGEIRLAFDERDIRLRIGESTKVKFILPPGVDDFYMKGMIVSSWSGQSGGGILYAHSLEDFNSPNDYPLETATALGNRVWLASYEDDSIALTKIELKKQRTVYFLIKNASGQEWVSASMMIAMRVRDIETYNNWVKNGDPVTAQVDPDVSSPSLIEEKTQIDLPPIPSSKCK